MTADKDMKSLSLPLKNSFEIAILGNYVLKFPPLLMACLLKLNEFISFPLTYWRYRQNKWLNKL